MANPACSSKALGLSASETASHTPHGPSLTVPTLTLTDIAALPAHRRQAALVRWSLIAVPDRGAAPLRRHDPRDPLNRPRRPEGHA